MTVPATALTVAVPATVPPDGPELTVTVTASVPAVTALPNPSARVAVRPKVAPAVTVAGGWAATATYAAAPVAVTL